MLYLNFFRMILIKTKIMNKMSQFFNNEKKNILIFLLFILEILFY